MQHQLNLDEISFRLPYQERQSDNLLTLAQLQGWEDAAQINKEWDRLDQQPLDPIQLITGFRFSEFRRKTASSSNSYKPVYTVHGLVDVTFRRYVEDYIVDHIVVHGRGCRVVPYRPDQMAATAASYGFRLDTLHYNVDISPSIVTWPTIMDHFNTSVRAYTATATATPFVPKTELDGETPDPGWRVGKADKNGYAVSFYPSGDIHADLPPGTWRIEVQAKGATALRLLDQDDKTAAVLGMIQERITFRSRTQTAANRSKRSVPRWWTAILQGAGSFRVAAENPAPTLEGRKKYTKAELYKRKLLLGDSVFLDALNEFLGECWPGMSVQGA